MRKAIFTLTIMAIMLCSLLLSPAPTIPAAHCEGDRCSEVWSTCAQAGLAFYDACRAGGGDKRACEADTMTWVNNCMVANGCEPVGN